MGVNPSAGGNLEAYRGDVTSTVAAAVDGGPGGSYNFSVSETNTTEQDGEALVVVYSLASIATNTVAILNGAASSTGDVSHVNFAQPLDPTRLDSLLTWRSATALAAAVKRRQLLSTGRR